MLLLLSLACTDPEAIAVAACEAVPTVAPDAAGLARITPLITAAELAAVTGVEPTAGAQAVGDLAPLVAQTSCSADSVEGAGSGAWAVALTRTAPQVGADGSIGEAVTTSFTWQVTSDEGGRAEPGLPKAAAMRRSIAEALGEGDLRRVAATTRTLASSFPDPTLAVDVALAEAALEKSEYDIGAAFVGANDTHVQGQLENTGDRALVDVTVTAEFEGAGSTTAQVASVAAGETVSFEVPLAPGAAGGVVLQVSAFEFGD